MLMCMSMRAMLARRTARMVRRGLGVRRGIGGEFGFASGAAEQHLFAVMHQPVPRIGFWDHAANRVALAVRVYRVLVVMIGLIHGSYADRTALLI